MITGDKYQHIRKMGFSRVFAGGLEVDGAHHKHRQDHMVLCLFCVGHVLWIQRLVFSCLVNCCLLGLAGKCLYLCEGRGRG